MHGLGKNPSAHYDDISDGWRHIFGDNFHFGYFASPDISLDQATEALVEQLASLGELDEMSLVLDVGCGVGAPAFYLHQKYRCSVVGISTSQRGIDLATAAGREKGMSDKVEFRLADGAATGFSDGHFDMVWVLESSHLMDKKRLFSESYRILRPGGQLLLCDIMLKRKLDIVDEMRRLWRLKSRYVAGYLAMKKAFASGKVESIGYYVENLQAAGFSRIKPVDVSEKVLPTMSRWRANIAARREEILRTFSKDKIDAFITASEFLDYLFSNQVMGYGLIKALKPQ